MPSDPPNALGEIIGVVSAGVTAALAGIGRSHMKVRDRLQHAEVRLEAMEEKLDKAEATHESVIRLECAILGIEDDMKTSMRRQEKIQKTITSIERMFKIESGDD